MSPFQHIYDGKNTAVTLPSGERLDRAQENMSNLILQAEKLKLDSFKKNEEWYLKTQDVPLETYISAANTETQAKLIDAYNDQAQSILKARGGDFNKLTTQDKLELAKGRKFLESQQQKMLTDLVRFKEMDKTIQARQDLYDTDEWNVIKLDYLKNGTLPEVELPIRPISFTKLLAEESYKSFRGVQDVDLERKDEAGRKYKTTIKANRTVEQAKGDIKDLILHNEAGRKDVYRQFDGLSPQEKAKWLFDENNDNKIDEGEEKNGIIRWAQNNQEFIDAAIIKQVNQYSSDNPPSNKSFDWNINIGAGHNKNEEYPIQPGIKQTTAYGTIQLPDVVSLGVSSQSTEQQQIPEVLEIDKNGKEVITQINDAARFNIISYSPSRDLLIVKILDNGEELMQGDVVALPAARYDNLLKRKPFAIDRASMRKEKTTPVNTVTDVSNLFQMK